MFRSGYLGFDIALDDALAEMDRSDDVLGVVLAVPLTSTRTNLSPRSRRCSHRIHGSFADGGSSRVSLTIARKKKDGCGPWGFSGKKS